MVTKRELEQVEKRLKTTLESVKENIVELSSDIDGAVTRGTDLLNQIKAKIEELAEISSVDSAMFDDELAGFDAFNSELDALSEKAKKVAVEVRQDVPSTTPETEPPINTVPSDNGQPDPVEQVDPSITPPPVQDMPPFQETTRPLPDV